MEIRKLTESDYETLEKWWKAWNWPPIKQDFLPENGTAGFDRKANKYVANIVNNSAAAEAEVRFGNVISGVKGYYLDVQFSTDSVTDPGGFKGLYSVGLNYSACILKASVATVKLA